MIKKYFLIVCLSLGQHFYARGEIVYQIPDTLLYKNYDYLFNRVEEHQNDSVKQAQYLRAYLTNARNEENWQEIVNGFKNYLHHSPDHLKLIYADSMIYMAKASKDTALIGSAYLSKGIVFYGQKKHMEALDNYLIAHDFISKTNDQYQKYKAQYNLAHVKYYLGFYDEAITLFEECLDYFKKENTRAYLNTIHSIALCYNRIGDFGLSTEMNELGLTEGNRLSNNAMEPYFIHLEGINHYFKNNFATAIEKITRSLPAIQQNKDFANEAVGNFYIGKSYWDLRKHEKAVTYFKKVDQVFEEKDYIRPDLRENFELLIEYYKNKDNPKAKLHYIKKLLKADSILSVNYRYLSGRIHKEYDTRELVNERDRIQNLLDKRKRNTIILISIIFLLFFLLLFLAYRYLRNKKLYRQRYEELMKKNEKAQAAVEAKKTNKTDLDINPEAVATVLKQLEKFERDKKFLEKNWTLVKLSAAFNSNTNYLSKIVSYHRGKKIVEYLNDLKIDHIIELLKNDKKIRNYTNGALAEEAGFSSTQRFTNAFISRTGISPSYFIQELKKEKE